MQVSDDELRALAEARGIAPDDWKGLARALAGERKPGPRGRRKGMRKPKKGKAEELHALWMEYVVKTNEIASASPDAWRTAPAPKEVYALMKTVKRYRNKPIDRDMRRIKKKQREWAEQEMAKFILCGTLIK